MIENNLKKYIEERGITIKHIQGVTGIRYATLLDIINGKNNLINLKYLNEIMKAINVSDFNLIFKKQ